MKVHGLMFKPDTVHALLNTKRDTWPPVPIQDGGAFKGVTRRVNGLEFINKDPDDWRFVGKTPDHDVPFPVDSGDIHRPWFQWSGIRNNRKTFIVQGPVGKPGDLIYVKETYGEIELWRPPAFDVDGYYNETVYKATFEQDYDENTRDHLDPFKWKSPRYMPRHEARLWLEVISCVPERLHSITEQQAIWEGIAPEGQGWKSYETISTGKHKGKPRPHSVVPNANPVTTYKELWQSINRDPLKPESHWCKNPWVWCVSFKVLSNEAAQVLLRKLFPGYFWVENLKYK